jgi:hypothetical protein
VGISVDKARAGLSWTLDRAGACWFATTAYRSELKAGWDMTPLVLRQGAARVIIVS